MKRRIAPRLLALAASWHGGGVEATLLDDHGLTIKPALARELRALARGEFAPAPPEVVDRAFRRRALQPGGVLARERASPTAHESTYTPKSEEECSSPLVEWTTRRVREMGAAAYRELFESKVPQMAYVYKHYVDRTHEDEYFVDEAQTAELNKRHADTVRFWREADMDNSIMTDEVLLLSMHGEDLKDNAKLVPTLEKMFDFQDMSDVLAFATKVQGMIEALPMGYNNPLLTMNAVATRSTHDRGSFGGHANPDRRIKDSVIVGDGVLQFLYDSGLHASGPDFVYAHEFGHHLQFQMDLAVPSGAKYAHDDRRKELMADALAGYFLAHDDGGDFDAAAIGIFDRTAFATGDCSTGRGDHHGTPEQRRCAALWGASRAAEDDAPVLDPEEFVWSFNGAYLGILGLEASACTLILEEASADEPPEAEIPSFTVAEESQENVQASAFQEEGNDGEETSGDAPISIVDWLEAVQQQNGQEASKDWSEEDEAGAVRHEELQGPEEQVFGVPSDSRFPWEAPDDPSYDQPSRGRPSSSAPDYIILGQRPASNEEPNPAEMGSGAQYQHLADRGTAPSETWESYAGQELSERDCRRPWVYCPELQNEGVARRAVGAVGLVVAAAWACWT